MQGMATMAKTSVASKATIPSPKITSTMPPITCFKLPRLALQSAGIALVASTALVLTPLDARAAPTITFASPEVKRSIDARDKAMEFQCKGGMFDCDSDRREFAKNQYKEFVKRNGGIVPEEETTAAVSDNDDLNSVKTVVAAASSTMN